jgi:hypothetical protein
MSFDPTMVALARTLFRLFTIIALTPSLSLILPVVHSMMSCNSTWIEGDWIEIELPLLFFTDSTFEVRQREFI